MVELHFVRTYAAPRRLVWDAWTDPDQMAQWWGPARRLHPARVDRARPAGPAVS